MLLPDEVDRLVDKPPFGVVQPVLVTRHLGDDRFEHREAVDQIVIVLARKMLIDHPERVDRDARGQLELGKRAAKSLGHTGMTVELPRLIQDGI